MKARETIDNTLDAAKLHLQKEVGDLLGHKVSLSDPRGRFISKVNFFSRFESKNVLVKFEVSGELEGIIYLNFSMKDAITLGGTLIMLPDAELEAHISKGEFGEDEADAFGEITNIICGLYTKSFTEQFPQKIHFKKTDLVVFQPSEIDIDSPDPIPDVGYYLVSFPMVLGEKQLGEFDTLFPAELFGMEFVEEQGVAEKVQGEEGEKQAEPAASDDGITESPPTDVGASETELGAPAAQEDAAVTPAQDVSASAAINQESTRVIILADEVQDAQPFMSTLQECGFEPNIMNFNDNIKDVVAQGVRGIFIILNEVNEQGMAALIKISSACSGGYPLVIAGPEWTRKTVMQAVKYGACDIVMTPASPDEIKGKICQHFGSV